MIPAHVAQERNTRSAADLTKHSYRGLHRMLTIVVTAHRGFELCKHPGASQLEALDVVEHEAAMLGDAGVFETGLDALEIFLDLFDEDENIGQRAHIWGPALRV